MWEHLPGTKAGANLESQGGGHRCVCLEKSLLVQLDTRVPTIPSSPQKESSKFQNIEK